MHTELLKNKKFGVVIVVSIHSLIVFVLVTLMFVKLSMTEGLNSLEQMSILNKKIHFVTCDKY